jgi:hypothetical protein
MVLPDVADNAVAKNLLLELQGLTNKALDFLLFRCKTEHVVSKW